MKRVLEDLACKRGELSILFTDDGHMRELNRQYRAKDMPTNVLAFPMSDDRGCPGSGMLGDIVISVDTAMREAEETGETPEEIAYRLLIHGLLHLMGYDHERSEMDEEIMMKEEARLGMLIREERDGATGGKH